MTNPRVDTTRSPFYEWLDNAAIRDVVHRALALTVGERIILLKGLVPSLVDELGEAAVGQVMIELTTKAQRYQEAVTHPGQGRGTRTTPGEALGGPTPEGEVHANVARDPRHHGGRAHERRLEAALWADVEGGDRPEADPSAPFEGDR